MAKHARATSFVGADAQEPERYPLLVRIFGVLAILGGGMQVLTFVLALLALLRGWIDLSPLEGRAATTLVVSLVALALSFVLAALFVALGIRLLRGKRQASALLANLMISLEAALLVCLVMLGGVDGQLIAPVVNMAILVALQTYSDPSLRDERRLQRHLQALEDKQRAEDGTLGLDTSGRGYIALNFYNIFWVFVVCCVLGLIIELAWHMIVVDPGVYQNRAGMLYGPFSPIYGVGAVLMTAALNRFHKSNFVVIFLISALIGGAFEYATSWFFEFAFGITAWDYTGTFLSIDGRTNGMFMAMWGLLGLLWVKLLLPRVLHLVNRIPWNLRYTVTVVAAAFMLVDAGLTLASFDCWYQREAGTMDYAHTSAIVEFCNEHYDNTFMENRFQTMTIDASHAVRVD